MCRLTPLHNRPNRIATGHTFLGHPKPSSPTQGRSSELTPDRLKAELQTPDLAVTWNLACCIEHLNAKLRTRNAEFLSALVAALNDRAKLSDLDLLPD
ncbi:MAG TPA: hypothetical protein DCE44_20550 [Verrucomicrobiales bacterium]|nr:hypothetical protein [Verrucomicrobiales bacterium]